MGNHFFQGNIPLSLKTLRGLEEIDLSHNKLVGEIPKYLETFLLKYLNLSFNHFEGEVPKSGIFANASAFSVKKKSQSKLIVGCGTCLLIGWFRPKMAPLYYDHGQSPMELQNTPFTVQLGRGASIQLANAVINTGDSKATIQFGSLEFSAATVMDTAIPIHGMTVKGHSVRPDSAETYARCAYSVQQPRAARIATAKAVQ
ncbi:hypothetical protein IEQ34_020923 [Dendrobium chrysotoxum]|uniref:Uncharacterized protein n=1 Tax=Dendrobium chrysotoxum TaxID=161865 RepID=A0AAV7G283_DENCH|nr:hypothetical protein IEQ34_020923 [Dendrobium chrysotoxum]